VGGGQNLVFWQMRQDRKKELNILQNEADILETENIQANSELVKYQ
jgi:hypothetical protein